MILSDRGVAEDLLKKAKELEPDNPEWSQQLAHMYELDSMRHGDRQPVAC